MKPAWIRRMTGIALCACLLAGQGVPAAGDGTAYAEKTVKETVTATVKTSGGSLNLRASPVAGAKVLTTIPNGTKLEITTRGTEWCGTSYKGYAGYVMTSFLSYGSATTPPAATPSPAQATATPAGTWTAYVKTTGGSLNLRISAQSGARVLITIPNGTRLTVTQKGATWCKTSYGGFTGYVMTSFLSFRTATPSPAATAAPAATGPPEATPTASPAGTWTAYVKTTGGSLNLRVSAQSGARVLITIPNGTRLTVTQKGATWCKTSYGGFTGYVMTSFLSFSAATATPSPAATATPAATAPPEATPTATPAPYDTAIFKRTLRLGYTGRDVELFKERLTELHYPAGSSGTYDTATVAAVKMFQKFNGLTADGIAGAKTFTALFSENVVEYSSELEGYKPIRIDDGDASTVSGAGVTQLQSKLKDLGYAVRVTGTFDTSTHNAVVAFQLRNGMTPEGVATEAFQIKLFSGSANDADTPYSEPGPDEGRMTGPAVSSVSLLHWYDSVKPSISSGQNLLVFDPDTGLGWTLRLYSCGQHADSEPRTLLDTQIMNRSFGATSWAIHAVYVKLPDGRWTMAAMHNRPHLYGAVNGNGFSGHLCVHFLRDLDECQANAPDYGMDNQRALRSAWKALTGETVE